MNHQESLATVYSFYEEKTLTVPLRNVSKLVRREDHSLNKPPNSMLSINLNSVTGECGNVIANSLETF